MGAIDFPSNLGTPQVADACAVLGIEFRSGPTGIRPLKSGMRCAGRVLPLPYDGASERFFQILDRAVRGDILVIDNSGRLDESCMGDVMAYELRASGLGGLVIWGAHRDTEALAGMDWPIFSLGTNPSAPRRDGGGAPLRVTARCGSSVVSSDDFAICDVDGVVFVKAEERSRIVNAAEAITQRETSMIAALEAGKSLRQQLGYDNFVKRQQKDPSLHFSDHIKEYSTERKI